MCGAGAAAASTRRYTSAGWHARQRRDSALPPALCARPHRRSRCSAERRHRCAVQTNDVFAFISETWPAAGPLADARSCGRRDRAAARRRAKLLCSCRDAAGGIRPIAATNECDVVARRLQYAGAGTLRQATTNRGRGECGGCSATVTAHLFARSRRRRPVVVHRSSLMHASTQSVVQRCVPSPPQPPSSVRATHTQQLPTQQRATHHSSEAVAPAPLTRNAVHEGLWLCQSASWCALQQ